MSLFNMVTLSMFVILVVLLFVLIPFFVENRSKTSQAQIAADAFRATHKCPDLPALHNAEKTRTN
jgi:uncharacterized protein involved in outer membrane biogenesis